MKKSAQKDRDIFNCAKFSTFVAVTWVLLGTPWLFGQDKATATESLHAQMEAVELNTNLTPYVRGGKARSDYSGVKVTLPPKIGLQEHPRIYMSRAEIVKWREEMQITERGRAAFKSVLDTASGWLNKEIVMPDPKVPAQLNYHDNTVAKTHNDLSSGAGRLGWAYQFTDNEAFAAKAREILVGYAKLYPNDYKEHQGLEPHDRSKVMAQRLSEAMWLLPLIQAYDMIYDAKCMTDADRKLIENDLLRTAITYILTHGRSDLAAELKKRDAKSPHWRTEEPSTDGMAYNWVNFYNATFVQAGIVMGDQDWIDIGAADTRRQIAQGIGEDGMWKEGSIGYQVFARLALIACTEPLARQGVDVYSSNKCRFKNLFDAAYKYAYPDRTMPGINDSCRLSVEGDATYDYGWLRYHDPNYGAVVNAAPRQIIQSEGIYFPTLIYDKLPEQSAMQGFGSIMFDSLGYNIMRGENSGKPTYLLLKAGAPAGRPHDHPDNLNLIIFADGDELCGEPGGFGYGDSRFLEWGRPTVCHYSLTVDEHDQAKGASRLIGFYDAGAVKVMRGQSGAAYPGVNLDRTVVQMPGYVVDLYQAWSKTNHTFDYPLCFRGELDALKGVSAANVKPMGQEVGYKLFMTQDPVTISGSWSGVWKREAIAEDKKAKVTGSPANEVNVMVLGDGETKVYNGTCPDERQKTILRRSGTSTMFAAVIEPFKDGRVVKSAENIKVSGPVPAYGLKVTRTDGGIDLIIVRLDAQKDHKLAAASTFDNGTTDALVSVVRMDRSGKVIETGMLGGTRLVSGSKTLTLPGPGISWER